MVRMQIQLTPEQHRRLHGRAKRLDLSVSEVVRRCIDGELAREDAEPAREERVRAALAVVGRYEDPGGRSRVAEEHDDHLARAFRG